MVSTVGNSSSLYPFWAINWRRTSAAVIRVYRRVVRNCGSAWLCPSTMAVISVNKLGKWSSLCLRPRNEKPSTHLIALSTSCIPLRMVPRFQPSSRSASLCPPSPSACTVRAINIRRALPLSSFAVFNTSALTSSVRSTLVPPSFLCFTQYTILGQFSFRKSLTEWERDFYLTIMRKRNLTEKQSTKKLQINDRVLRHVRRQRLLSWGFEGEKGKEGHGNLACWEEVVVFSPSFFSVFPPFSPV